MVVIVTGTLQAVRLVGGPSGLADTAHGRLLAFKLVALGAMLYVADVNRRRVNRRFTSVTTATRGAEIALRRAMTTESVLGLGILMVTAALVVSPPATSRHRVQEVGSDRTEVAALDRQLTSGSGTIRVKVDEARLGARTILHVTPIEPKAETVHVQPRPVREPDRSTALDLRPQGGTFSAELPLTGGRGLAPPDRRGREPGGPLRGDDGGETLKLLLSVVKAERSPVSRFAAILVAAGVLALSACSGDDAETPASEQTAPSTPVSPGTATADAGANEADVSFVQGMIPHHEQAVEMAEAGVDPRGLRPARR